MADTTALKNRIRAAIKANDNQEITGPVLQNILLDIVNELDLVPELENEARQRQNEDNTLQQNITAEKNRAEGAESTLQQNITAEKNRAEGAESTLQQNITAEKNRAEGAESTLQQNIVTEKTARQQGDTQLNNLIIGIKNNIDSGYVYVGVATPSTVPASGKVFYVAVQAGTYTNFDSVSVSQGISIIKYNGSSWSVESIIDVDDKPTAGSNNMVKSGGVQNELALGAVYDVSAKNPTAGPNNDGKFALGYILNQNNVNALIPTAYRKGGMSIKFIQSDDDKYVQYRLTANTFSTSYSDWIKNDSVTTNNIVNYAVTTDKLGDRAVTSTKIETNAVTTSKIDDNAVTFDKLDPYMIDDEPIASSNNLVKSGGVHNMVNALHEGLLAGDIVPALAENLKSWAGNTQNANYTQENVVETTGGDLSIDSSVPATLMSIAAKTDFSATKLIATGFNLLRRATAVGNGWYFMVPALPFGTINTASQPNGVLFTNSQGENLLPRVLFRPLSSGVPTSVTDGIPCAYTDVSTGGKDYRFYTTSQAGYIIVSNIDRATTCAHLGWSKRYDEYIAIDNPNDAGSEVDIAAGIHALHSYDKMLTVGNSADRIEKSGDSQIMWHRLVDRVQPTWTNTPVESEGESTGDYIHTAVISGMKPNGAVAFETLDITLLVDGTTISFTDNNATVEDDYVKYELATEATGTAAVGSTFSVEDWGLIIIQGAEGSAYINIAYAQGIPDSVRQMLSNIDNKTIPVIAEALLYLYNENKALRELLTGKDNAVLPYIKAQTIEFENLVSLGAPNILESEVAGAPSAANVPKNWNNDTMGVWDGCPRKVGQQYVDQSSKKVYYAPVVTGSTADWVALN